MKTFLGVAAIAACLTGAGLVAAQAEDLTAGGRIHVAQMDSPGDGLDGSTASRQGNARPGEMGSAGPRRARPIRRKRLRR